MNDRYLFRGKRVDNGEWVQGYYRDSPTFGGRRVNIIYMHCKPADGIAVKLNTVGQCTGVKDKNGKLIFEGDIIKASIKSYLEVAPIRWYHAMWSFGDGEMSYPLADFMNIEIEIIGNIHDNPEMLKNP